MERVIERQAKGKEEVQHRAKRAQTKNLRLRQSIEQFKIKQALETQAKLKEIESKLQQAEEKREHFIEEIKLTAQKFQIRRSSVDVAAEGAQ